MQGARLAILFLFLYICPAKGSVDLCCLFLQQFEVYLYKVEYMWCSYST